MASRKIEDLLVQLQTKFHEFRIATDQAGLQFIVTCTYRSQEEQNELYAQGRTKPGKKVTWTKNSKHTLRRAFDIALLGKNGKITWDLKASVNKNEIPDYTELGLIGESLGLTWGGRFGDYCHFELEEDNKCLT